MHASRSSKYLGKLPEHLRRHGHLRLFLALEEAFAAPKGSAAASNVNQPAVQTMPAVNLLVAGLPVCCLSSFPPSHMLPVEFPAVAHSRAGRVHERLALHMAAVARNLSRSMANFVPILGLCLIC